MHQRSERLQRLQRRRRHIIRMIACTGCAVAVPLMSVSCSTTADAGGPTSAAIPDVQLTSTTAVENASSAAVATYNGMWQAMAKAATTSNWRDPDLSKFATGDALAVITRSLYVDHQNGVVTRGAPTTNPRVTSSSSTKVVIADCGDDSGWLKYKANGQLQNGTPGGHRAITAEVQRQADGSWRVARFAVEGVGSC